MQSGAQCALTLFWWQVVLEVLGFGSALVSTPRSHQVWKHLQTHRRHLQMPREEEAAASNLAVLAHLGFGQSSALVCNLATLARLGCGSTCWCLLWTHLQTQRRRQRTQHRQLHTSYRLACVVLYLFDHLAVLAHLGFGWSAAIVSTSHLWNHLRLGCVSTRWGQQHLQTQRRRLQIHWDEATASNPATFASLACWGLLWTHLQTQRRRQRTQQRQLHTPYRLACVVHLFDLAILRGQLWPNLACANLARANLARGCLGCNFANFVHDSSTWRWVRGEACKKWKSMQILGTN